MSELKIFENAQFGSVRVIMRGNDPWFVARDVAVCLGYTNPAEAVRNYCKKAIVIGERTSANPLFSGVSIFLTPENSGSQSFGNCSPLDPQTKLIPESDFYRLVLRSHLPSAEAFQDWIVEEVLPSIRKTGMYMPGTYLEALEQCVALEKARLAEEEAKRKAQLALQTEQTAHNQTKKLLTDISAVTKELLVTLGLAGEYRTVKSLRWLRQITGADLPKGNEADNKYWGPIGGAITRLCRAHGGFHLTSSGVPCTYELFKTRQPWCPIRIADKDYGTINTYPLCAVEAFKNAVAAGMYDKNSFARYFRPDYKELLSKLS